MAWNLDFWFKFGGPGRSGPNGDIGSFMASIAKRGVARKSRYRVAVTPPSGLSGSVSILEMKCEAVTMPGQNIRSVPDTLRFGPEREHPQGMTYGPISATFICDKYLRERGFFEIWQQMTVNKETWEPKYYDTTVGEMKIFQLDEQNNDTYGVHIFEVFPKLVGPVDVSQAAGSTYQTVTIELAFHHWIAIDGERTSNPITTPTKGDPAREKIAPLQETRHGFHARNYKKSSLLKPGDAFFNPAASDPNAL